PVDVGCPPPRLVGQHEVERVHVGLATVDGGQVLLDDLDRRPLPGADRGRDLDRAHYGASPRMRGTRKRPSSTAGAWASTSSRARQGTTTSSRNTFSSGSGCAVGGTPSVSSDATSSAWSRIAP